MIWVGARTGERGSDTSPERRIAPLGSEKRRIDWSTLSVTHAEPVATVRALGDGPTGACAAMSPVAGASRTRRPPPVVETVAQTAPVESCSAVARPGSGAATATCAVSGSTRHRRAPAASHTPSGPTASR